MKAGTALYGRRALAILTVVSMVMSLVFLFGGPADASGDGSTAECETGIQASGDGDLRTYTAPEGQIVTGVCIKAGQLHTGLLGNGAGACYTVEGVGTDSVTITRTGTPGPDCQEISHVDVAVAEEPPPSGWVCVDGEVEFLEDASEFDGTVYESEEAAAADPDCAEEPPSGWVCADGEVEFLDDTTGFDGQVYETEEAAANDPGCAEVSASTTFSIAGACGVVSGVAMYSISGNLGEGLTLEVAGQTITTAGPFSIDPGAAGSYPYEVSTDVGFVLAAGSPATTGTISLDDCTPVDVVLASIVVTVTGSCEIVDGDGVGQIDVNVSVDGGATVVVRDAQGNVEGTLTSDGIITVAEGESYTWEATPSEGFEFPAGSPTSGTVVIESCSNPETLPFTGLDTGLMAGLAAVLVAAGIALVRWPRGRHVA